MFQNLLIVNSFNKVNSWNTTTCQFYLNTRSHDSNSELTCKSNDPFYGQTMYPAPNTNFASPCIQHTQCVHTITLDAKHRTANHCRSHNLDYPLSDIGIPSIQLFFISATFPSLEEGPINGPSIGQFLKSGVYLALYTCILG